MIHGWDPRSTLEAVIPVGASADTIENEEGGDIGCKILPTTREQVNNVYAKQSRIEPTHVMIGYAHIMRRLDQEFLEIAGATYIIIPVVHFSNIKPVMIFPDRPRSRMHPMKLSYLKTVGFEIDIEMDMN
ncbi:hypothetical protein PHMEG_0004664 [Phytophthora megakarya]|uniref:Uncharacterized protein n=1 Tax=Phytophthora megakarya TaxID=4795 RepID=A0A225WTE0_9STRA|nr:hypothetical protein PHMEG_0004664 [Phytophthora megakarya]